MKVSMCIPSYNYPNVVKTIRSVMAQSFPDWELLIEDDGSTDETPTVLRQIVDELNDPRIQLKLKAQNEGQNKTTNNLMQRAQGEYICALPCDDLIVPDKLAKQVAYLDANPSCGIVFGWPRFVNGDGNPVKYPQDGIEDIKNTKREAWIDRFQGGNCLFIATSMYRRSLHDTLGYFTESLALLADLEWYVRILKAGNDLHIMQEQMATITLRENQGNLSAMTIEKTEKHCDELQSIRDTLYIVKRDTPKIYFATPFYDVKGYSAYINSMFQTVYALARHTKTEFDFLELSGDSYIWRARNLLAERFLQTDGTHLFFIDSDQGWSLESIMRILKADKDIVGGAYPSKNNWEHYSVTIYTDANGIPDVEKETGLIRAQKVPTGFMKIKREVFDTIRRKLPNNWYWEGIGGSPRKMYDYFGHMTVNHVKTGEDISFCQRWQLCGGEIWVEPRCTISHVGSQTWTGNYHTYLTQQPGGSQDPKLTLVKKEAA